MPTNNPRLTITLQPTLSAQLRTLSGLTGNSQSALIADLLEGSSPIFDRMITVLQAAEDAKLSMRGSVGADLKSASDQLEKQLGLTLEAIDRVAERPMLEVMEKVQRRARRTAPDGAHSAPAGTGAAAVGTKRTPISNRGVRSDHIARKVTKRGPR